MAEIIKIRVRIHHRGSCTFIVKNKKKIRFWMKMSQISPPDKAIHSGVSVKILKIEK